MLALAGRVDRYATDIPVEYHDLLMEKYPARRLTRSRFSTTRGRQDEQD
jgi:hypothetical protein